MLILALQNRQLAQRLVVAQDEIDFPYESMYVPSAIGLDLAGGSVQIGHPSKNSQVLFFINTTCPHGLASLPAVKRMAGAFANRSSSDFYIVSEDAVDETRRYAGENRLSSNVIVVTEARDISLFHARSVPMLMVIDKNGKVAMSRVGSLNGKEDVDSVIAAVRALDAPTGLIGENAIESAHP